MSKKSRIRETLNLSTCVYSRTNGKMEIKEEENKENNIMHFASDVISQMSRGMSQMSCVTWYLLLFTALVLYLRCPLVCG